MQKKHRKSGGNRNGVATSVPWNDQVANLISREGIPREKARDRVILEELRRGNTGALAALLLEGHVPAPNVRFAIALMLLDNDAASSAMTRHHAEAGPLWLPHRLVMKPRPAQPRLSAAPREGRAENGAERKSGPVMQDLGYEAAIARLDQAVLATDAPRAVAQPARRRPAPSAKHKK